MEPLDNGTPHSLPIAYNACDRSARKMIQLRLNTLWLKIESCCTFLTMAEIKHALGDKAHAQRFFTSGEGEYVSLLSLFSESRALSANKELRSGIVRAGEQLNRVQCLTRLNLAPALRPTPPAAAKPRSACT